MQLHKNTLAVAETLLSSDGLSALESAEEQFTAHTVHALALTYALTVQVYSSAQSNAVTISALTLMNIMLHSSKKVYLHELVKTDFNSITLIAEIV